MRAGAATGCEDCPVVVDRLVVSIRWSGEHETCPRREQERPAGCRSGEYRSDDRGAAWAAGPTRGLVVVPHRHAGARGHGRSGRPDDERYEVWRRSSRSSRWRHLRRVGCPPLPVEKAVARSAMLVVCVRAPCRPRGAADPGLSGAVADRRVRAPGLRHKIAGRHFPRWGSGLTGQVLEIEKCAPINYPGVVIPPVREQRPRPRPLPGRRLQPQGPEPRRTTA